MPPRVLISRALAPFLLAALVLLQAGRFQATTSATYDEVTYLHLAEEVYRTGSFDGLIRQGVPPLPVLLTGWASAFAAKSVPFGADEVPLLVSRARWAAATLVGVPLVLAVYLLLNYPYGPVVGALGGGLAALSPSLIAHGSLATTDACFALFALVALAATQAYGEAPTSRRFLVMGVALGLAMASKQSALFLFVIATGFLAWLAWRDTGQLPAPRRLMTVIARLAGQMAALVCIALLVSWALYGFATGPLFYPRSLPRLFGLLAPFGASADGPRAPAPVLTLLTQLGHLRGGHPAFLLGATSVQGWWYFFPVALFLKSTPAEVLLGVVATVGVALNRQRMTAFFWLWWGALALFFVFALFSRVNAGHRYVLVLYPLLVLCAVSTVVSSAAPNRAPVVLGMLLAGQAWSAATTMPGYLTYFPFYVGGPSQGYRYLVDSSLDWGQDLPALRNALEQRHYHRVLLAYFGQASPAAYGIRAVAWHEATSADMTTCDWIAVSATQLQGVYSGREEFAAFRELVPTARAGHSIFLFQLSDPMVKSALEHARLERARGRTPR